ETTGAPKRVAPTTPAQPHPPVDATARAPAKHVTERCPYIHGTRIAIDFHPTYTGNTVLTAVKVIDALPGLSPVSCPGTTLAAGATMTCTATYTVSAADVTAGNVHNSATAEGTPPATPDNPTPTPVTPPTPAETDTPVQAPALTLAKRVTSTGPYALGSTIAYAFDLANTGNTVLTAVKVI